MASELEVARLVVRLLGDASEFLKPMKDAKDVTDSLTKAVGDIAKEAKKSAETPIVAPKVVTSVKEATAAVYDLSAATRKHKEEMASLHKELQAPLDDLKQRLENVR